MSHADPAERAEKRARVDALLDREGLDTLVLRSPANVAWWSGGGRTTVLLDMPVGVAAVVLTRDGERVLTDRIEADRVAEEELDALVAAGAGMDVRPWDAEPDLPSGEGVADDVWRPGVRDAAPLLDELRRALTPAEISRYRDLGREAAEAMTDACLQVEPGMSEYAAAGLVAAALYQRGIDPVLVLAAGEGRVFRHRHALPTLGPVGDLLMLVTCGRRDGLYANLTRFTAFGAGPARAAREEVQGRLLAVEAAYFAALRPGTPVSEVLAAGMAAYGDNGFAPDEGQRHHQGGPCGYLSRDYKATPRTTDPVEADQAFAWNPSVPGLKVEDTVLATAAGVEVLSVDPRWPTVQAAGRARPAVLER